MQIFFLLLEGGIFLTVLEALSENFFIRKPVSHEFHFHKVRAFLNYCACGGQSR